MFCRSKGMISTAKLGTILKKRDDDKIKKTVLGVLAIFGAMAAIAGVAYAIYRFITPNYLKNFEEDFEDNFEDEYLDAGEIED